MTENELFILLGTNLGDRLTNLEKAKSIIFDKIGSTIDSSKIYETEAWGITNQPNFLNQVLVIKTSLSALKILKIILKIENEMGRIRDQRWGARLIDIDILYFGKSIIQKPNLTIPHPFLHERRFTLVPLVEIAPDFIHPIFQKKNSQLLAFCTDISNVISLDN